MLKLSVIKKLIFWDWGKF